MNVLNYVQACYVVPDLEEGMKTWTRLTGIGPWYVMKDVVPDNGVYRGRPMDVKFSCALTQPGPIQIELIEQHNDGPSVYRDMFPAGSPGGFHHFCIFTDDIEAEIAAHAARGVELAYRANFGAVKFGYFDTRPQLGTFTEVIERDPGTLELWKMIADAGANWDGSDPVRYVG